MYNNIHQSEFSDKFAEFGPSHPFRTTTSFNSAFSAPNNAGRARQGSLPVTSSGAHTFRDTSNFSQHYAVDVFATAQPNIQSISSPQSQSHQQQSNPGGNTFDSMQPPRGFEFGPGSQQMPSGVIGSAHPKFTNVDPFSAGAGASLLSTHKPGAGQSQNQGLQTLGGYQQGQYLNGMSHQSQNMRSQTPYGPHLPASASAPILSQGQGPSGHTNPNGAPQQSAQEEISTIFVVGFPEDMQEREFQNMFTFSQGFEAATLKIPNKELTAYGSGTRSAGPGSGPLGYMQTHGGPNDPYNLVTINQGGIVVDSARDGTTSSWQNPSLDAESHLASNQNPNISTRKQIIGFAKFRTRKEALEARDTLQGRRVDLEKGAVLKAEMAKKNLHTKRGIGIGAGPLGAQVGGIAGMMGSGGGLPGEASLAGLQGMGGMQINGMHGLGMGPSGAEALTQREKELGTLGAMGFAGLGMNGRKEGQDERAFGSTGARGARERAEEEERKSRVDVERERSARLRSSNAYAFDAFHSVPPSSQAVGNSLLAATAGTTEANLSSSQSDPASRVFTSHGNIASPWGMGGGRDNGAALNNAYRKMSAAVPGSTLPPRPTSPFSQRTSQQSSPPNREANAFGPPPGLSAAGFSPPSQANSLPAHPSLPSRPRAYSPTGGSASASSVGDSVSVGEREASDEEMSRGMQSLAVSTQSIGGSGTTDLTSPQLPSPASAGSKSGSGSGSSAVDQNPPINTLYVGNLPSSPSPPGMSPSYLEDSLRELFSRRPGFRKLCFRQKSNGPMCFVEFCDVQYATKALNDLYGATLNGLVKGGGIRLSYSKNPLGVRTPTSGQSQPQQAFSGETFQPRTLPELDMGNLRSRRDASGVTSPTASSPYQFSVSPPPPRFVSPPPGSFVASSFARASQSQGFGGYPQQSSLSNPPSSTSSSFSSFSPFGNSQSPHPSAFTPIPEQTSSATPIGNNTISNISDPASNCIGNPSNSSMQNTIHISNPTPIPDGSDQYSLQPLQ